MLGWTFLHGPLEKEIYTIIEDHLNTQKGILEQTRIGFVLVYFFSCIISSSLIMLAKLRGGGHLVRVLCGYQP